MNADCEANYARLLRLANAGGVELLAVAEGMDQAVEADVDYDHAQFNVEMPGLEPTQVALSVCERSPYTTTVNVQVGVEYFGEVGDTNLTVRLYHDVNLAEVVACNRLRSKLARYSYPNASMFQPDEKAQQNRFLAEWLSLTLLHGLCTSAGIASAFTAGAKTQDLSTARSLPARKVNA